MLQDLTVKALRNKHFQTRITKYDELSIQSISQHKNKYSGPKTSLPTVAKINIFPFLYKGYILS